MTLREAGVATVPLETAEFRRKQHRSVAVAAWVIGILAALLVSRWLLFPRYLITFDEINFALARDHFDPRLHQPQPPGYPVFVALLKFLSLTGLRVEFVFLLAALLLSAGSLFFLWRMCDSIGGRVCGLAAALLLLLNPAFWLAAVTNPVRLCFAAGAIAVAWCLWIASERQSTRWLVAAAAGLGLSAGARPALAVMMAPLMLWAWWRLGAKWKTGAVAVLAFGIAIATWLPALVLASGGLQPFIAMLTSYSDQQMSGTSFLFGAPPADALRMAWEAVAWSCLGALSWIWCLPFAMRGRRNPFDPVKSIFLAAWFLPGLIFYAVFHVGDPDHTLSIVPAVCVAGALLLAQQPPRRRVWMIGLAVLLNAFLFLKPISVTTKPSTYKPVQWMRDYIADVIDGVEGLQGNAPVTAIFAEDITGWRQLSYYDPRVHIIVLVKGSDGRMRTRHLIGRRAAERPVGDNTVVLPSSGILAWIDPALRPVASSGASIAVTHSRVFFTTAKAGESFELRGVHFISGAETPSRAMP